MCVFVPVYVWGVSLCVCKLNRKLHALSKGWVTWVALC